MPPLQPTKSDEAIEAMYLARLEQAKKTTGDSAVARALDRLDKSLQVAMAELADTKVGLLVDPPVV